MSKLTKKQLEEQINKETLSNDKLVFYTLVKKHGNMLGSVASNNVLLIFFPYDNALYYGKEQESKTIPFVEESNIHKKKNKDTVNVMKSVVSNPAGTPELHIKYQKPDQKGKETTEEWKFDLANKQISQQWAQMLTKHKNANQNTSPSNILGPSNLNKQSSGPGNTMNVQPKKEQDAFQFLLTESKVILNKPEEPKVNPPPPQSNIGVSNLNLPQSSVVRDPISSNGSKIKPAISLEESRLQEAYQLTDFGMKQSQIKPQNQSSLSEDWNYKFVKEPTRQTVYRFQKAAYSAFVNVLDSKGLKGSVVKTELANFSIQIVDCITKESKRLKNQYRNYHYILESCKNGIILGVPLACLIEQKGFVCLVKAKFPKDAVKLKNKRDAQQVIAELQHKTKISNNILFVSRCSLYDLTRLYGSIGEASRIYVDELDQYMPELNFKGKQKQQKEQCSFYVRPNLMQYFQNRVVPGGDVQAQKNSKMQGQFYSALQTQIKDIAECLSNQEIYVTNIFDLKQFLHFRGVNMKFLYKIYQETKNKFVKKYLLTCLVAKLIKDQIYIELNILVRDVQEPRIEEFVQDQIRCFIEGRSATTNQYWKRLSLEYRNLHGSSLNTHELIGGFLLSCIMVLVRGEYDLSRLDKSKSIFKDQGIIKKGFVKNMDPKIKSYYRFDSKIAQTVEICKYSEQNQGVFKRLVGYMELNSKPVPQSYNVNNSRPYILGYLSDFVPPQGIGYQTIPCSREIYGLANQEPPSAPTLKVTLNYFNSYLKYLKQEKNRSSQDFEAKIHNSIQILNYWLQIQHPKVCQFYQKAANYEQICGNTEQSLQILEKAIEIAYKTQAKNTKKIGIRHYVAGCQYLKAGKKKQATDNLQKAKTCLQKVEGQQSQHALTLSKLSSLQLNNGDTESCIKYSKQALRSAQKGKMTDAYIIKIYEILCRAYEIKGEKEQLKKLSVQCSKEFHKTQQRIAFGQMVKICLTGTLARLSVERSNSLLTLARQLKQEGMVKDQNQSITLLMEKAKSFNVMQNFMNKSDSVQKYLNQYMAKKQMSVDATEFVSLLALISGVVGIDFIEGLHDQKEFQ